MKVNFIEELKWRGMLHDSMPGTEEKLMSGVCSAYIGFDPTADSLGVGNLVQIMTLMHFQRAGHIPIALIGGATGMIGDPSGKSAERNLLDEETLRHNQECQKRQLERFLDFNAVDNPARIVNNIDWFKGIGFLDFIRDTGKRITVNYMMSKDSVKNRISGENREGMSFTEFTYQLIQGYDFYYLWKNQGVSLQMGGSDQWGNITTGTELIRRMGGGEAFALTTPLIKKSDGTKFGKTEGGNIWLDPTKTSPYKFYQFWLNASDEDCPGYMKIFSLKGREEVEALIAEHALDPGRRSLQKLLAAEITERVHGAEALSQALVASQLLFGQADVSALRTLTHEQIREVFEGVGQGKLLRADLEAGMKVQDVFAQSGFLSSNSEVRRALQENSLSLNKEKVNEQKNVTMEDVLVGKYLLLQRGKKSYFLVEVE
jgi:tyrosyl-tRNA synthetase